MGSLPDEPESRDNQVERYLQREGLVVEQEVIDRAEEEYDTMSDSTSSSTQPDDEPDPGCDVLGFGRVRLGTPEPLSPASNEGDICCEEMPVLSPGGSSDMENEIDQPETPSREQEGFESECSIASTNEGSPPQSCNAVIEKPLSHIVLDEIPIRQREGQVQSDDMSLNERANTEASASPTAATVVTVVVAVMEERPLTPPGMWPCKVLDCEAGPFKAKWQLTSHQAVHKSKKDIPCTFLGCKKSFRRRNEQMRHEKTVHKMHGKNGFNCPWCPRTEHQFPRMDNLKRHVDRAHSDHVEEFSHTLKVRGPGHFAG